MDIEQLVSGYVQLRNKKAALEAKHKEELKPYKELMDKIEVRMLAHMQEMGTTSLATKGGTAYQTVRSYATVADRDAFKTYCETEDAWELADIRPSKSAIKAVLEDTGELPPGINWREELGVNFRK